MFHDHHHHHNHFNPGAKEHAHSPRNARMMKLASYGSIGVAILLMTGKTAAWWQSESLAMLSSLTDSIFDLVSSVVNLLALRYALKPADDDHRFGHTSAEDIAGLGQCAFISASMILIILQSVERLWNPHPLGETELGMWVSGAAMIITALLVTYQTIVTRRTGSLIVASDRLHYAGDMAFNAGVLVSLLLSRHFGISWIDPVMAIAIAVVVLWSNRTIGIRAFNNLMDREMPDTEKEKIRSIVMGIAEVKGVHKVKTRYSGAKAFIQMHVDIDASLNFRDAHDITERLEDALLAEFPSAEIIIHPDPTEGVRAIAV